MQEVTAAQYEDWHDDGYLVLRDALPPALIERCHNMAMAIFEECNAHIDARPFPLGIGKEGGFAEIVQRQRNRYEMRYGMGMEEHPRKGGAGTADAPSDEAALMELRQIVLGPHLQEVIGRCLSAQDAPPVQPVLDASSCLISLPGCEAQEWHSDGPHTSQTTHLPCHLLNVFIPLSDPRVLPSGFDIAQPAPNGSSCELNTGTEIRPGTQFLTRNTTPMMLQAELDETLREPLVPEVRPGDILIFDYRVLHRGCANPIGGRPRPVAVFTFAQPGCNDGFNFPHGSIFDIRPGARHHLSSGPRHGLQASDSTN